ncbi:MAG: hypothetical protein IPL46_00040 [Saprospiraceae bacterium]|nr:hypothetical protein [Saprospiraceae bacterium]
MINMVMGKSGPIWYRNLAREHDGRPKDSQEQLESVLNYYAVDRMIIGHTVMPDICADYQGKLIKIDILHGQSKKYRVYQRYPRRKIIRYTKLMIWVTKKDYN